MGIKLLRIAGIDRLRGLLRREDLLNWLALHDNAEPGGREVPA